MTKKALKTKSHASLLAKRTLARAAEVVAAGGGAVETALMISSVINI